MTYLIAYLLLFLGGVFGAHRIYLGRESGIVMLLLSGTVIGLAITLPWAVIDFFLIPGMIRKDNEENETPLHRLLRKVADKIATAPVQAPVTENQDTRLHKSAETAPVQALVTENQDARLHKAAENDVVNYVRKLLEKGADANAKDHEGSTPLHAATKGNATDVAALLLQHGADIEAKDSFGTTPLHWVAFFTSIHAEKRQGSPGDMFSLLLQHGADIATTSTAGDTPLHWAALYSNHEFATLLLQHGADPLQADKEGKTPWDIVIEEGNSDMIRLFKNATE